MDRWGGGAVNTLLVDRGAVNLLLVDRFGGGGSKYIISGPVWGGGGTVNTLLVDRWGGQ